MEYLNVNDADIPSIPELNVDTGEPGALILPENIVAARTAKAAFGLQNTGKTYNDVYDAISSGNEQGLRFEVAAKIDEEKNKKLQDAVVQLSNRRPGPLTEPELRILQTATGTDKPTNPSSVLENQYAVNYLEGTLHSQLAPDKSTWFEDAFRTNYQQLNQEIKIGTEYLTKDTRLQNAIDNVKTIAEAQSSDWRHSNYLGNLLKDVVTLGMRSTFVKRGNVPGVGFFDGFAGENQRKQGIELYRLPMDQFDAKVSEIEKWAHDDPELALHTLMALKGDFSPGEEDVWEIFNLATLPGYGLLGKTALGLGKGTFSTARAIKDVIESRNSTEPPKIAAAVAVGDLDKVAVEKVTAQVAASKQTGADPRADIIAAMPKNMREKAESAAANPGAGPDATELTNRVVQGWENLIGKVENVTARLQRVNRTPAPLADEATVRLIKEETKENYKGVSSRILTIGDATYVPHVNNYYWELQLGHYDGTMFKSPEAAAAAAVMEGIVLRGEKDAARQLDLQRTVAKTTQELDFNRALMNPTPEARAFIGDVSVEYGARDLVKENSVLEKKLAELQKELDVLRASPGAVIEQQGTHFYISRYVPYDESGKVTRANLFTTKDSKPASGFLSEFMNSFAGWLRTGDETLSKDAMANAKMALYGQNPLVQLAKSELKEVNKRGRWTLPGGSRRKAVQEMEEALDFGRTQFDPRTKEQGYLFDSVGELQDHFMRNYGHWASPQQVSSYFAAKRYGELQRTLYDIKRYSEEARQGAGSFQIRLTGEDGKAVQSPMFKGLNSPNFKGDPDGWVYIPDGDLTRAEVFRGQASKDIQEGVTQGRIKAVKILYPNDKPLNDLKGIFGNNHIEHVLTEVLDQHPLEFTRSDFRGGGLWDLDHPFYIKQARLEWDPITKSMRYKGDRTLMPMASAAQARQIVEHLEAVRTNLSAAYAKIAKDYTADVSAEYAAAQAASKKLPIEFQQHVNWFNDTKDAAGNVVPPKYNVHEPWQVVPGNSLISNMDNNLSKRMEGKYGVGKFKDDTKGNLIFRNLIKNEQDTFELYTMRNEGTRANPDWKYEPAKYIDPLPAMNRGMRSIVNSALMDDFKDFTIEHWIQAAKDHLQATPAQLAHSPEYYFYHGQYKPNTPLDVQSRLNDWSQKARGVWGTPSVTDNFIQLVSQHMYDGAYEGGRLAKLQMIPAWMLAKSTDAAAAVRSITYHATLGMLALPQYIVQNMGYITIQGVAGSGYTGAGALAMLLHQYSRVMPQHIDFLDKLASKAINVPSVRNAAVVGFKPGQFKEAWQGMLDSGFNIVGTDNSIRAMSGQTGKVITSGGEQVLDLLSMAFTEGEKQLRYGAWYTSYLKHRAENPTGPISRDDWRNILNRADMYAGSMSAASKSMMQKGPLSFTTQFTGYALRTAELMTGKRLTWQEKASLLTTYWAMGGVSALGLYGLPGGDVARKWAVDNGYNKNSDAYQRFVMEGLPAEALRFITGGNDYNVGGRYFDPGFTPIRDYMTGDKGLWQVLGGASGNMLSNVWTLGDGYKRALMSVVKNEQTYFPMTFSDAARPLKAVGSVNNFTRFMDALHDGNWWTRNGQKLVDGISPLNAAFMTISGLQPLEGSGTSQALYSIDKDRKHYEEENEKAFKASYRRWVQAGIDKDESAQQVYGSQMMNIRQKLSPEKLGHLMQSLSQENQTLVKRGEYGHYLRPTVPGNERPALQKTYREMQQGIK